MTTTTEMSRRDAIALVAGTTAGLLTAESESHAEEKKVFGRQVRLRRGA